MPCRNRVDNDCPGSLANHGIPEEDNHRLSRRRTKRNTNDRWRQSRRRVEAVFILAGSCDITLTSHDPAYIFHVGPSVERAKNCNEPFRHAASEWQGALMGC